MLHSFSCKRAFQAFQPHDHIAGTVDFGILHVRSGERSVLETYSDLDDGACQETGRFTTGAVTKYAGSISWISQRQTSVATSKKNEFIFWILCILSIVVAGVSPFSILCSLVLQSSSEYSSPAFPSSSSSGTAFEKRQSHELCTLVELNISRGDDREPFVDVNSVAVLLRRIRGNWFLRDARSR